MSTLGEEALGVNLADDHLFFEAETFATGDERAVLIDEGIAGEDDILGALAKSAGTVHIAGDASGTLLTDEREQVLVLADEFVGGTQIEDDFSTFKG